MYYRPRVVDSILEDRLDSKGAVLIEGAKWCGKTTTASQIARSRIHMQDPAMKQQNLRMAELHPQLLLEGNTPRLIDEWQLAPQLWDAVRFEVDRRGAFGQFILTGSSTPVESELISHSGTGRIARLLMRPMSLYESDESNGKISLKSLFESEEIACTSDRTILDYAFFICRGGWPLSLGQKESVALRQAIDYVDSIVESDISLGEGIPRDPTRVRAFMRSYARHVSTRAKTTTIQNDILASLSTMDINTLDRYLNDLRRIFVVEEMEAWNPKLRSKTAVRTSVTRHFVDPSIATASLRVGPQDLLSDLKTMGLYFESLVIRDLRVYTALMEGNIYHYRDASGLESDAVIHLHDGHYALVEVKMADSESDLAAQNLLKLKNRIDTDQMKEPSFMAIITAGEYGYQRHDGIYVVPLACLGP
ncbi:MAG TPA: DUF4143 domain-containing protein [Bacillota bacterium]|nr:DUF4143 domain-containing protein [Bacillota bacterium]